jgi:hypothetical protein
MERGANMTRHIPMLFSPAMVDALLAGRKTETRRILKPQPESYQNDAGETCDIYPYRVEGETRSRIASGFKGSGVLTTQVCRAEVGDLIWVKEAHFAYGWWETTDELTKSGKPKRQFVRDPAMGPICFHPIEEVKPQSLERSFGLYRRSSLFLPKLDSRLTLRVTGFSIERLHEIDEASAAAEGVERLSNPASQKYPFKIYCTRTIGEGCSSAKRSYRTLWNSINGFHAWDANPWVDVTKFEVLRQNVERIAA